MQCHERGWNLIECIFTLALMGIFANFSWSAWQAWGDTYAIRATVEQMKLIWHNAEVLRQLYTSPLMLCHSQDGKNCSQSYHNQYLLQLKTAETRWQTLRLFPALTQKTTVAWHFFGEEQANAAIYFLPETLATPNGSIIFCRHHRPKYALIINKMGELRELSVEQWPSSAMSLQAHFSTLSTEC